MLNARELIIQKHRRFEFALCCLYPDSLLAGWDSCYDVVVAAGEWMMVGDPTDEFSAFLFAASSGNFIENSLTGDGECMVFVSE